VSRVGLWIAGHKAEARAAIRATVAGVLSYGVAAFFGLPEPYWAVMSTLLVIQSTVGASLQSSVDRLAGTVGGVVYGGVVGWLIPGQGAQSVLLALAVALVPLTLLAAFSSRYRIAPVTAVIALILPREVDTGPVQFALERTIEVGIGGLVAVAVAFLVLPARGRRLLAEAAAAAFRALADTLSALGTATPDSTSIAALLAAVDVKRKALGDAATETQRERRMHLSDDPDPAPLILATNRIRTDIVMLFRATRAPLPEPVRQHLDPLLADVADRVSSYLRALADAVETESALPAPDGLRAALAECSAQLGAVRSAALSQSLANDVVERLFSLGFAVEQLADNLIALADCCVPYAGPSPERDAATSAA
jgi:uncharacterized membrane protein YccC